MKSIAATGKLLLGVLLTLIFLSPTRTWGQAKKQVTLEDVFQKRTFSVQYTNDINWMKGDRISELTDDNNLVRSAIDTTLKKDTLIHASELINPTTGSALQISEYAFSDNEQKVLIGTERRAIYRHSFLEKVYVFDLSSRKLLEVFGGKPLSYPAFSPDGSKLGFTFENNLYYADLGSGQVTQVTRDGLKNSIINGGTDWVYEEEFTSPAGDPTGYPRGFYWSPDSKRLAYYRFDESSVKIYALDYFRELYPDRYEFKYPKAGEANATVGVWVYDLPGQKAVRVDVGNDTNQYIPRICWTNSTATVAFLRLNRTQNKLELLLADATTGASHTILTETSDTYVDIEAQRLTFLKKSNTFLWTSERSGYLQAYLYDLDGKLHAQLTSGNDDLTEVYGVDETHKLFYYQANGGNAAEKHIYAVGLDGKNKHALSPLPGTHDAAFSAEFGYFIDSYSTTEQPPVTALYTAQGKLVRVLESNHDLVERLKQYSISPVHFFDLKTEDGIVLKARIQKPVGFDSTQKYPVLMYVYGGPGAQTVENQYQGRTGLFNQLLLDKGYIIVSVDNRGTGGRGTAFKNCTYMNLGKLEVQDQIAAAKYLGHLPYVDAGRIGIWGWSYGGYMTSLCLTKGAAVFKTGVAVAPVTNWRYYDTIYTERYLRTPQENPDGYDQNSPVNFADKLKGNNFLLMHGLADDNVHFQNSAMFINALIAANKPIDLFVYPNKNHGIYGGNTTNFLFTKMYNFLLEKL